MDLHRQIRAFWRKRRAPLLLAGAAAALVYLFWTSLPARLFDEPLSPVLFSAEGRLLGARPAADGQWRFPALPDPPRRFFQVLIQYEDRRFLVHPGVDVRAMGRALVQNIRSGRVRSGGSTLTMQVIRMSRHRRGRTIFEKARESLLALRLELTASKAEILALYAANAPFGGNIVGLHAASWFYFGRGPEKLSWAEAAFLAVLPNDPGLIASARGRVRLREKRDRLLDRLKAVGMLSPLDHRLALAEAVPDGLRPVPRLAPHLLESLASRRREGAPLFRSFLKADLQETLTEVLEEEHARLASRNIRNAAAVVIDNRSAAVVAYAGNVGGRRRGDFGQDVDLLRRPRSTGSILKPFLYAVQLQEGGLSPRQLVADVPVRLRGFSPENFDRRFRGAVPARSALAWSLNVPAVKNLQQFGPARFQSLLRRWGLTTLFRPAGEYGLSLILGGAEGSLLEIAGLYAKLAQAAMVRPEGGSEIRILQSEADRPSKMADLRPGAAWLTLEALTEVNRPDEEGSWKSFSSSRWAAWKTGTSFGLRDAWAVGVTPNYTIGVWAGNADGEDNAELTGLSTAAPILFAVLNRLPTGGAVAKPSLFLRSAALCRESGYLAGPDCPSVEAEIPRDSPYNRVCPFHRIAHLDAARRYRVDSRCESVERMVHAPWFVLPPVQEYYYRKYHPEYRVLPPFRADCAGVLEAESPRLVMNLVYPEPDTAVFIPTELDGGPGHVVFEAVHRNAGAVIYWHVDDEFIASTRTFHQVTLRPEPGGHQLVLVDDEGRRLERSFQVLSREEKKGAPRNGERD